MDILKLQINGVDIEVHEMRDNICRLRKDDKLLKKYVDDLYNNNCLKDFPIHGRIKSIYIYENEQIVCEPDQMQDQNIYDIDDIDADADLVENFSANSTFPCSESTSCFESTSYSDFNNLDPKNSELIWTTRGKPTSRDIEATYFFLSIRGNDHYIKCFNDKKSSHNILWRDISKKMNEAGYWVGEGKLAVDKLRHKFKNLIKSYMNFVDYVKRTTGTAKKDPPQFYEELHRILGDKDKTNPKLIIDSDLNNSEVIVPTTPLPDSEEACRIPLEESIATTDVVVDEDQLITKETLNQNRTAKKRASMSINEEINLRLKNIETNSEKHFSEMFKLMDDQNKILREQNSQRDKLIKIFESMVNKEKKTKKRRHSSSSSDS